MHLLCSIVHVWLTSCPYGQSAWIGMFSSIFFRYLYTSFWDPLHNRPALANDQIVYQGKHNPTKSTIQHKMNECYEIYAIDYGGFETGGQQDIFASFIIIGYTWWVHHGQRTPAFYSKCVMPVGQIGGVGPPDSPHEWKKCQLCRLSDQTFIAFQVLSIFSLTLRIGVPIALI